MTRTVFTALNSVRSRSSTYVKYVHYKILARSCTSYVTTIEHIELRGMSRVYEIHEIREFWMHDIETTRDPQAT